MMTDENTLTMRSIYVSSTTDHADGFTDHGDSESSTTQMPTNNNANGDIAIENDDDESKDDAITLPQSTHSLLFTEPVFSLGFGFGFVILNITCWSLSFALIDALTSGGPGNQFNIPADVTFAVRGSQYMSILIALLMEEEIPTGLYLLRMIPRKSFESKFPDKAYSKFVISCVLRIGLGYNFLMNVFFILIQATGVLEIFYDVMALQFVQQLDDISFKLAKMDMAGKSIYHATASKCYRAEFKKQKGGKKMRVFLKAVVFLNLGVFLAGMAIVSTRQKNGFYQCNEITVDLGDGIWDDAVVKNNSTGQFDDGWILEYSHFNGVYVKDGSYNGRPVYKEMRKYEDIAPYETIIGAEIKYCTKEKTWIFSHQDIRKSKDSEESDCSQWLLRSPKTVSFDLLNVDGDWDVWVGAVSKTSVSLVCNECRKNFGCNLNGECVNGKCQCRNRDGVQYLGTHCTIRFEDSCHNITSDAHNDTWSVAYVPSPEGSSANKTMLQQYNRPVYYISGLHVDGHWSLVYSGRRWFVVHLDPEEWEYHAFWDEIYSNKTAFVSDSTASSTPAGIDFYWIGDRDEISDLTPDYLNNQTGRGVYRCSGSNSTREKSRRASSDRRLMLKRVLKRGLGTPAK